MKLNADVNFPVSSIDVLSSCTGSWEGAEGWEKGSGAWLGLCLPRWIVKENISYLFRKNIFIYDFLK